MKPRAKRILVIATIGVLASLTFAMYPALLPDRATDSCLRTERLLTDCCREPLRDAVGELDIHYTINVTDPAGITLYIGDIKPKVFSLLHEAKWDIHLFTRDGRLVAETSELDLHAINRLSHVRYSSMVEISEEAAREKQPDGSYHPIYSVNLIFSASVQPSFWGKSTNTLALQTLKVDPIAASVDAEEPRVSLEAVMGKHTSLYVHYPVEGLPSRFGETQREKALNSMLLNLGRVDSAFLAADAAAKIPAAAEKMLAAHTDTDKAWPDCWGDAAPLAEQCAKAIVPTLLYLQDNACFGSKGLADFINSPAFARFFGDSFSDKVPHPLDEPMESFPIEEVPDLDHAE